MTAGRASCSRRQSGPLQNSKLRWRPPPGRLSVAPGVPARRGQHAGDGARAAVRIIYFVVSRRGVVYLIDIYAKGEKEDLTDAQRREIRRLVVALEAEG
jgi:hypothetical protein